MGRKRVWRCLFSHNTVVSCVRILMHFRYLPFFIQPDLNNNSNNSNSNNDDDENENENGNEKDNGNDNNDNDSNDNDTE